MKYADNPGTGTSGLKVLKRRCDQFRRDRRRVPSLSQKRQGQGERQRRRIIMRETTAYVQAITYRPKRISKPLIKVDDIFSHL